jgi:hypothetical protein
VDVIDGAWLRSGRRGVVAGIAASALHGASWVDDYIAVELIWNNTIIARAERLETDEMTTRQCIAVTTAARTAYDLGRHLPRLEALVRLDALKRATGFSNDDGSGWRGGTNSRPHIRGFGCARLGRSVASYAAEPLVATSAGTRRRCEPVAINTLTRTSAR